MRIRAVTIALAVGLFGVAIPPDAATADGAVPQAIDPACEESPQGRFADTIGVHAAGVDCIGWWGVTQGDGEGSYSPDALVRRDQMATFIARTVELSGGVLPAAPPELFDDVSGTHALAVYQLAELGVVGGVSSTQYNPTGTVNRAQMAAFLARAYEARSGTPLPLGDVSFPDIEGNVHADNIVRIATAGLTGGTADGSYDPGGAVTRAQMGTFLARFLALLVDEGTASYPPANPVPLPSYEPVGQPVEVAYDPVILGSFDVEVPPGEVVSYTAPLVNLSGWTEAWFSDGDATDIPGSCDPSGPYGADSGVTAAMSIVLPGQPAEDADSLFFDSWNCIGAVHFSPREAPAPLGSEARLHLRNDGQEVFHGRAHMGQSGEFAAVEHPAGSTETYAFETFDRLDPSMTIGSGGLRRDTHPVAVWWYGVVLAEASDVQLIATPTVQDSYQYCDLWIDHYAPDGEWTETGVEPVLVEQSDRCYYEITDVPPGRLQYVVYAEDVLLVTVTPSS